MKTEANTLACSADMAAPLAEAISLELDAYRRLDEARTVGEVKRARRDLDIAVEIQAGALLAENEVNFYLSGLEQESDLTGPWA